MENIARLRNIAVVGPHHAGKTTLVEALLAHCGAIPRRGSVRDGTTTTDCEPEAIGHLQSVCVRVRAHDVRRRSTSTLVDTPGFVDFFEETKTVLTAVDAAVDRHRRRTRSRRPNGRRSWNTWRCARRRISFSSTSSIGRARTSTRRWPRCARRTARTSSRRNCRSGAGRRRSRATSTSTHAHGARNSDGATEIDDPDADARRGRRAAHHAARSARRLRRHADGRAARRQGSRAGRDRPRPVRGLRARSDHPGAGRQRAGEHRRRRARRRDRAAVPVAGDRAAHGRRRPRRRAARRRARRRAGLQDDRQPAAGKAVGGARVHRHAHARDAARRRVARRRDGAPLGHRAAVRQEARAGHERRDPARSSRSRGSKASRPATRSARRTPAC